jgi:hypothetical protein
MCACQENADLTQQQIHLLVGPVPQRLPIYNQQANNIQKKYHAGVTAVDHKSSAFYSLEDGIALTCRVAIGSMMTKGGYVVYIHNDTFTKEWTTED